MGNEDRENNDLEAKQSETLQVSVRLATAKEVALILNVPVSWVYERSRIGSIPSRRFGKYVRFDVEEVLATSERKSG